MTVRRSLAACAACAIMVLLLPTAPAAAHANLVRSEPSTGATLEIAPTTLVLTFSEALDPGFSRVELVNSQGVVIAPGPGSVDPDQPTILRLPVSGLARDSFTAVWRVRSTVDGHVTTGSVPFGVGTPADPTGLLAPLGAPEPSVALPRPLDAVLRWLGFACLALALGGVPFVLFVWRPGVDDARRRKIEAASVDPAAMDLAMTATVRRLVLAGTAGLAVVQLGLLVEQAALAADVPISAAFGSPILALLRARFGQLWLTRMALIAGLAGLAAFGRGLPPVAGNSPGRAIWRWYLALALAAGIVLTISLGGHGAALAERSGRAIAADWLHTMAMVAWLGSLPPLWAAISRARRDPDRALPLRYLIPSYSALAIVCVMLLAWTGVLSYLRQVERLDLLAATTYGRALAVKLALFGLLLGVGAVNLLVLSRRFRRAGAARSRDGVQATDAGRLARGFRLTTAAEIVLGVLLLAMVGVMTAVAPSKTAWEAQLQAGEVQRAEIDQVGLTLRVAPGLVGGNAVAVDVVDPRSGSAGLGDVQDARVLLRLSPPGAVVTPLQVEARVAPIRDADDRPAAVDEPPEPGGPGAITRRFVVHGNLFTRPGSWQVEAILRRRGMDDVRHVFTPRIVRLAEERRQPDPAAAAGLPVPASPTSIAAGAALFETHCVRCHGPAGGGDGPEAAGLDPPPADMRVHVPQHEPAQIYLFVQQGLPGSAMPAFGETMSHEEIWHVVNYLGATFGSP